MWQIFVSSICLASFKVAVAAPMSWSNINRQFEESVTSPANCPQLESLGNILVLLKQLLNQNDISYVLRPNERMQILESIKEYLEKSGSRVSAIDDHLKVKELISRTGKAVLVENVGSQQSIIDKNHKNDIEANFLLKKDIPSINNGECKEALAYLINMVKDVHSQMINYCNQSGKCNLNSHTDSSNTHYSDKSNIMHNILTLNHLMSSQSIPSPSITSINDLDNSKNQIQTHTNANVELNPRTQPESVLQSNQFKIPNMLNAGVIQTLNNKEKYKNVYNDIYLKKEAAQSNIQHSDKSNVFNGIFSVQNPTSPLQITPANRYPLNLYNVQSPLETLMIPQHQGDPTNTGSNDVLKLEIHPDSYLNSNQLLTSDMNTDVVQTKNLIKQEENLETSNNKYINHFDSNDIKGILYTPTSGLKHLEGLDNLLPLFQAQHAGYLSAALPSYYINNPYQQLAYKQSQMLNDKSASVGMVNQIKYNVDRNKYEEPSIPELVYNNLNGIKNFAPENLVPSKIETNLGQFQNDYMKLPVNPTLNSNFNVKQSPYLSSINFNRLNSYSSQQADAAIQSNLGLNLYGSTNLINYPKHDIYGNTLFDSQRLASMPNLVKLNSVADNEGIVELTYRLKRPQSISYTPYYYFKFRMPYKDFVAKFDDLSKDPDLRSNPKKVYEEFLAVSNFTEASPDLLNIGMDEVSKFILHNGGTLINAKVLGLNNSVVDQNLKTIQNLNANLHTNDILKVAQNDKLYNPYWSSKSPDSSIPIVRHEHNPYDGEASNLNVKPQYIPYLHKDDLLRPRRFLVPLAFDVPKSFPVSFLPAKLNSQIPSNPVSYPIIYSPLN